MTTDTLPQTFPETFRTACNHAAAADPTWHERFEHLDMPSCTPGELHALAAQAPNAYLSGFLAGHALAGVGRGD